MTNEQQALADMPIWLVILLAVVGGVSGEMWRADKEGARGWSLLRRLALRSGACMICGVGSLSASQVDSARALKAKRNMAAVAITVAGGIVGSIFGGALARRIPQAALRSTFALLLLIAGLGLAAKHLLSAV